MAELVTLAGEGISRFEEKKSVFCGRALPVGSEAEAAAAIAQTRAQNPEARHNVFAYLLGGGAVARASDDGEPQGTGGAPALEAIKKAGVTDACVIVTRYFGGVLLGVGGLARAYGFAARAAVADAGIAVYESRLICEISCSYAEYQRMPALLASFGAAPENVAFTDRVTFSAAVAEADSDRFSAAVSELSAGRARLLRPLSTEMRPRQS